MTILIADYHDERALFDGLLAPNPSQRILLFRGATGCGKTTLLRVCLEAAAAPAIDLIPVQIQFREEAVSVAEIFYRTGDKLGWNSFPRFLKVVEGMQRPNTVTIKHNKLIGINQRIEVALTGEKPEDVEYRLVMLTDAWFDDLRKLPNRLLLVFDTYEKAVEPVRRWFDGPFLTRVAGNTQIRVLVAGQQVPDANNIEWGSCCGERELRGVRNADHWLPVVEALNRHVAPAGDLHSFLVGVCHVLDGNPLEIMGIIKGLPERGPAT